MGTNIGYPTAAKTKPNVIAFDAELVPGTISIVGADLERNKLDIIVAWNGSSWGMPSFAPDDKKIVSHYDGDLWRTSLDSTSIRGLGDDYKFALLASAPNWRFTGRDTPADVNEPDENAAIPSTFTLDQNYPNPFNSSTVIPFDTRTWRPVELEIFNILGQRVFKHTVEDQPPGQHSITWDGRDQSGRAVPSGLYLYRVSADGIQQTRKMVVLK